jgi:glycerol uptake facilitator-like aquaporin
VLYWIASGKPGWVPDGFASNGYGDLSPGKYALGSCLVMEVLMTFFFLLIIAVAAEGQPECAKELSAGTAGHVHSESPSLFSASEEPFNHRLSRLDSQPSHYTEIPA